MEYLDIYDENKNHLGKEKRNIVHEKGLWHKTIHCWLYDSKGNIYFQVRKEEGTLYTTASGHVLAGETLKIGFAREIKEEIGLEINSEDTEFISEVKFMMDRENKDKTIFRDRAFANVYAYRFDGEYEEFNLDPNEVTALVKINAKQTLELLTKETGKIPGIVINAENKKSYEKEIEFKDFLVNKGETALGKYGEVLNKIISLTD